MKSHPCVLTLFVTGLLVLPTWAAGPTSIPDHQIRQIYNAAPAQARVTPKQPRRVLIFITPPHLMEKDPHKGYCIPYGAEALTALGRKTGAYQPVVSDDLAMWLPDRLGEFDAVVLNNASGPWITPTATD